MKTSSSRASVGGTGRSFDPFRVLSESERRNHLEDYERILELRNGEIDLSRRALSKREEFFRELAGEPISFRGELDRDGLERWLAGTGKPDLDPRSVLLVVVGKINESERYGVDLELARFNASNEHTADRKQLYLFLEEGYHSRILVEVCRICGVDLELRTPPWGTRWLIHLVRYLPNRIRWIPILCGEVVGCTVFKILIDHCDMFSDQPEVEARIRSLLEQIWTDEVLHVAYVRACLGAFAIRASRLLLPIVARSLTSGVPPLVRLGCSPSELLTRVRSGIDLPPQADWIAPDPKPA